MNRGQFGEIFPKASSKRLDRYFDGLVKTMEKYNINGPLRKAAFLAQVAHESGVFRYKEELASGDAYEFREDLGNSKNGDGRKYKGHGFIQITGKTNHLAFAIDFGFTIEDALDYLKSDEGACMSAGWFWNKKHLNVFADKGEFKKITKIINGGYNGLTERTAYYEKALKVLEG
jgi:predicted chitinase